MNKFSIAINDYKAKDVYKFWSKECKKAQTSLTVLSPVVDKTVYFLLTSKHIDSKIIKSVYTRIDSSAIYDMPFHLRALIYCLKKGIKVYHIDNLDSNSLILDDKFVSVGSQSFTTIARKNKATTFYSNVNLESSIFLKTLKEWMNKSNEIELDYLISLEKKLKKYRIIISKQKIEHEKAFNEVLVNSQKKKELEMLGFINFRRQISKIKYTSDFVYLTQARIGYFNRITTFLADPNVDLTEWDVASEITLNSLERLKYYPCINIEDTSIGYVRLTKTRISFFCSGIDFLRGFEINNRRFKTSIELPLLNTHIINFKISLKNDLFGNCELGLYFNGHNFNLVESLYSNVKVQEEIELYLLKNQISFNSLIQFVFRGTNLNTISKPINNFLKGWKYKLFIFQFHEQPILALRKVF